MEKKNLNWKKLLMDNPKAEDSNISYIGKDIQLQIGLGNISTRISVMLRNL